ncbi:hypothetical protein PIB30_101762, partial [Stylosanthes scabra]|nr:hypothetical protein [Stylosanthes scabra]
MNVNTYPKYFGSRWAKYAKLPPCPPLMRIKEQSPLFLFILLHSKKGRNRDKNSGDHYSPTTSGGHNFHTEVSIDAPFATTRNLSPPLRFYPNIE